MNFLKFYCLIGICLFALCAFSKASELGNLFYVPIDLQIDQSDVIVKARLKAISPPDGFLSTDFYQIQVDEIIAGKPEKMAFLVVETDVDSQLGSTAKIEAGVDYLLFLTKIDLQQEQLNKEDGYYSLLHSWHGMLPLSKDATEQRFLTYLKERGGIDIEKDLPFIVEAVKASVKTTDSNTQNNPKQASPLSDRAKEIHSILQLNHHDKQKVDKIKSTEEENK